MKFFGLHFKLDPLKRFHFCCDFCLIIYIHVHVCNNVLSECVYSIHFLHVPTSMQSYKAFKIFNNIIET